MKKNISINICGTIYSIDEDAYLLLDNYLMSMTNYFKGQEGGEEIADDIEHRVAELLWQYKQEGMEAVNVETVKEIINKIGNPREIDGQNSNGLDNGQAETDSQTTANRDDEEQQPEEQVSGSWTERLKNHLRNRRLYRNTQNAILGGVCSGLAEYVGFGDVTFWRLGMVLVTIFGSTFTGWLLPDFFGSFFLLLYVLLWMLVPVARTPEDRLRMRGQEVTPDNLKEQIVNDIEEGSQNPNHAAAQQGDNGSGGKGCIRLLFMLALGFLLLPLVSLLAGLIIFVVVLIGLGFGSLAFAGTMIPEVDFINTIFTSSSTMMWLGTLSAIIAVAIPIYAIIRVLRTNSKPLNVASILSLLVVWIASLAFCIISVILITQKIHEKKQNLFKDDCTRYGITLQSPGEWDRLAYMGWTIDTIDNVNKKMTERRSGFGGMPPYALRIKADKRGRAVTLKLENKDAYEQGNYVIEAIVETHGQGARLRVENTEGAEVATMELDDEGILLDTLSWQTAKNLPVFFNPDSTEWDDFAKDEDEHWTYLCSKPFHHEGGELKQQLLIQHAHLNQCHIRYVQIRRLED